MDRRNKGVLNFIENLNFSGVKKVLECIVEYMATTIIFVFLLGLCAEMGESLELEEEPYYWLYIAVYILILVVYKHIFINKIGKKEPIHMYSKVLYNRLFGIYLVLSTAVATGVEYLLMSEEERYSLFLYIPLILFFNYIAEKRYHYWGMMFFDTKAFIGAIIFVSLCNFIMLHFAYKGAALLIGAMAALAILAKLFSAFAPNGIVVDGRGNIGCFYRF